MKNLWKKLAAVIAAVCLVFTSSPMTALAAGESIDNPYIFYTDMLFSGEFTVNGLYAISNKTGDIYYYPNGILFTGGTADDGYFYDEDGKWLEPMGYTYRKHETEFLSGQDVVCDNIMEMVMFYNYLNDEYNNGQHTSSTGMYSSSDGKFKLVPSEFGLTYPDSNYQEVVATLAAQISPDLSDEDKIIMSGNLVRQYLTYDTSCTNISMSAAVTVRRGVCYHFERLQKDILEAVGIKAEILSGINLSKGNFHAWLRAWDSQDGKWIYQDLTYTSNMVNGEVPYATALTKYHAMSLNDDPYGIYLAYPSGQ